MARSVIDPSATASARAPRRPRRSRGEPDPPPAPAAEPAPSASPARPPRPGAAARRDRPAVRRGEFDRRARAGRRRRQAAAAGMPVYTIALGTQNGVVTVPDEFGVTPHRRRAARHGHARGDRRDDRRRSPSRPRPPPTSQAIYESLGSRVGTIRGAAGGHAMVRGGRARADARRRRSGCPLVQPVPMSRAGRPDRVAMALTTRPEPPFRWRRS